MNSIIQKTLKGIGLGAAVTALVFAGVQSNYLASSSHREAPMIANDPQADNTDVYAFRCPDDTNNICIIADYIPGELPDGGPNYYNFGQNIRYEIHIKNQTGSPGDDITYRFLFTQTNQDPTTFFNIRLGKQNLMDNYTCQKSTDGGNSWTTIISNGVVPPPNIGPRSISSPVGLNAPSYDSLMMAAITTATSGEKVYCGPADDPFFVDLGGIFDLGQTRAGGSGVNAPVDALHYRNVHVIAIKVPINMLQKDGKNVTQATSILDPDFVIGVWASSSRPQMRVYTDSGTINDHGTYIQISRLGMPLTNEAIIPIGKKDYWNSLTPYNGNDKAFIPYFTQPELALYMDNTEFGGAVPGLSKLRIQRNSLGLFGFGNNQQGLFGLYGNPATTGTALDTALFGKILLQDSAPRSVDILPIFYTGVPNLDPYQLATGKNGNPLAPGKPFINNFLPTLGDMLRLNMAVPVTPRNSNNFSSEGIVQAAVLGLTDTLYNKNTNLQFIPNMDGFPNGRRLEDDVTRIELQAVSGVALAAIGLWYDDYSGSGNPVTPDLVNVLTYTTGVEHNDTSFKSGFPYVQAPWPGYGHVGQLVVDTTTGVSMLGYSSPASVMLPSYPNPFSTSTNFRYHVVARTYISISVYDLVGHKVATVVNQVSAPGDFKIQWTPKNLANGTYIVTLSTNGQIVQSTKLTYVQQ
jgi:hypothetical protein